MKKKFFLTFSALLLSVTLSGVGTASADWIGPCKPWENFCHVDP
ncbi:hypothetical protein ABE073_19530 [Lederbergia citrisecunda]